MLRFWSWGCTGELDLTGSNEGLITEEIKCSGVCGEIVCCCSQGGYAIKCQSISDLYFNLIFYQKPPSGLMNTAVASVTVNWLVISIALKQLPARSCTFGALIVNVQPPTASWG